MLVQLGRQLAWDADAQELVLESGDGRVPALTRQDRACLALLASREGEVVSKADLALAICPDRVANVAAAWPAEGGQGNEKVRMSLERILYKTVHRLNQALGADGAAVRSRRGEGYVLTAQPPPIPWLPGWPAPDKALLSLMEEALHRAHQGGEGYVGFEHLGLALSAMDDDDWRLKGVGITLYFRSQLRRNQEALSRLLEGLKPKGLSDPPTGPAADALATVPPPAVVASPMPSPRLVALGARLAAGAGLDQLWTAIFADPRQPLLKVAPNGELSADPSTIAPKVGQGLPAGFQVIGGPEDGRDVWPRSGELVGRGGRASRADHKLYEHTLLQDGMLSRSALVWGEGGVVEIRQRARRERAGEKETLEPGEHTLFVRDLLLLGPATRLRILAEPAASPHPEGGV